MEFLATTVWLLCFVALVWGCWWLGQRSARKERRGQHRRLMMGVRPWWKEPPGDPPEEDY